MKTEGKQTDQQLSQGALDPDIIFKMVSGYWVSQVLYVSTKMDIFTILDGKELALDKISDLVKAPSSSTEKLLNACCALSLLKKENGKYSNSILSGKFLVKGKEGYTGYLVALLGELYTNWGGLFDAVKEDKPVHDRFGKGVKTTDEEARFFTLAMHSSSSANSKKLSKLLDLSDNKNLLDIGGGSGINSIVLSEKNPRLNAVVFDFPAVTKVADEFIEKSSVSDRVKTAEGDFSKDDLPKGFDCILLSHILHGEGKKGSRELLKKCYDALEPSGKIIIVDFMLNEKKDGPVFPALFALHMLIETSDGDTFSSEEIAGFLKEAGFKLDRIKPLGELSPATMVVAVKPGDPVNTQ